MTGTLSRTIESGQIESGQIESRRTESSSIRRADRTPYEKCTLANLHRSESGMMAWGTIFGVMTLMVFFAFVVNTIQTVNQKIETQNAADGVAYSSALWMARGMNTLTATNHMIGELNALYIIHHAFGGKRLDDTPTSRKNSSAYGPGRGVMHWKDMVWVPLPMPTVGNCTSWNTEIAIEFGIAKGLSSGSATPPLEFHKNIIGDRSKDPCSDINSTIFRGMRNLKRAYSQALIAHSIGGGVYQIPDPFGISKVVGTALMAIALIGEFKIWQEYLMLVALEAFIGSPIIKEPKKKIPALMDAIFLYQHVEVLGLTPGRALLSAGDVAGFHGATGTVRGRYGPYLRLPVEQEATTHESKNQLMRATFPWVPHWRKRPRDFFGSFVFWISQTGEQFTTWTNEWTKQNVERLRMKPKTYTGELVKVNGTTIGRRDLRLPGIGNDGLRLYVMMGLNDTGLEDGTPVTLYQHINYGGYRVPLGLGTHSLQGGTDNDCSSLRVTGGYRVTVYDGYLSGESRTYTSSASYVGEAFNDRMSSVKVERNPDTGVEKGSEDWTENNFTGAQKADHNFAIIGFARRPNIPIVAPTFFRQENPNGYVCYSQAMFYNANPQEGGGGGPGETQPVVGWDTLAWDFEAVDGQTNRMIEFKEGFEDDFGDPPRIKPNWQAKLCPVSAPQFGKAVVALSLQPGFVPDPMPASDRAAMKKILGGDLGEVFKDPGGSFTKIGSQVYLNNH